MGICFRGPFEVVVLTTRGRKDDGPEIITLPPWRKKTSARTNTQPLSHTTTATTTTTTTITTSTAATTMTIAITITITITTAITIIITITITITITIAITITVTITVTITTAITISISISISISITITIAIAIAITITTTTRRYFIVLVNAPKNLEVNVPQNHLATLVNGWRAPTLAELWAVALTTLGRKGDSRTPNANTPYGHLFSRTF